MPISQKPHTSLLKNYSTCIYGGIFLAVSVGQLAEAVIHFYSGDLDLFFGSLAVAVFFLPFFLYFFVYKTVQILKSAE